MRHLILGLALLAFAAPPAQALRVLAATNDLAALSRAVLGDDDPIDVVARPDRDPHALEVRPSALRRAARADVYVKVGLSLDMWSDAIVRGSRSRDLVVVDASEAVEPLEVPDGPVDASQGDVHPEGNPHYWLDPFNARTVARHLADAFGRIEPERAEEFLERADAFAARVEAQMPGWSERLSGRRFIEYHRTWAYLAARFDMEIVDCVEPLPGIPPSARHLADLARIIRDDGVPVVVRDEYHASGPVEWLERETGVRTDVLPSMCAEPTPDAFLLHFETIAAVLGATERTAP